MRNRGLGSPSGGPNRSAGSHIDCDAHAHPDPYCHPNANGDGHGDDHCDTNADAAATDGYLHGHSDANANVVDAANSDSHTDENGHGDADSISHATEVQAIPSPCAEEGMIIACQHADRHTGPS